MYLSSSAVLQWNSKRTGRVAMIQSIISGVEILSFLTGTSQMDSSQFICSFALGVEADDLAHPRELVSSILPCAFQCTRRLIAARFSQNETSE